VKRKRRRKKGKRKVHKIARRGRRIILIKMVTNAIEEGIDVKEQNTDIKG
jgi:hypothetical protein